MVGSSDSGVDAGVDAGGASRTAPARRAVEVVEVAPRDGLQNEAAVLPTEAKLRLINGLVAAGARRIEATSFVTPGSFRRWPTRRRSPRRFRVARSRGSDWC